ncbi:DMT family transporter [Alicyclobacillus sendaiensis]|uniref:DMT family transporter n=1 Tax=Alicyclobacillus sendaiensis TaxID=192387 RepID=UPI0007847FC9|nr:multidrug resistance efflux transporter family protein [Alicyclobacillus sendaiensis]
MTWPAAFRAARWRPLVLGLMASLFFAVTFVANEAVSRTGGSWAWNAPLRYFLTLPVLFAYVAWKGRIGALFQSFRRDFWRWTVYGTIGFGLFYAPLCLANAYGPAWLVAGVWQVTIVCGVLLTPWLSAPGPDGRRARIPVRELVTSLGIVAGAMLMEMADASQMSWRRAALCAVSLLVAATAYPAGNRLAMRAYAGAFDPLERMLGMTLGSLPFWIAWSSASTALVGWPTLRQILGALLVAVCSGVIATALFFRATDMARQSPSELAAVEATQAGEVVFALVLELAVIPGDRVGWLGAVGLATVVVGLLVHGLAMAARPVSSEGGE